MKYLYHCSPIDIRDKYLIPFGISTLLSGEPAIYAAPLWIAIIFGCRWEKNDISIICIDGVCTILELRKNGFDVFDTDCYAYKVAAIDFNTDKRLSLMCYEFIARKKIKILQKIHIRSVAAKMRKFSKEGKLRIVRFNSPSYHKLIKLAKS
jgi:hypothetical protein